MTHERASATCPQIVLDWIAWYPDGDLPPDVCGAIEVHAAECAACRREIQELAGQSTPEPEPAEGAERVFARVREKIVRQPLRSAAPPRGRRRWVVRPRYAVAAGLAVAVLSGTLGVVVTRQLDSAPSYETAGMAPAWPARDAGRNLDVVFRADASFAQIRGAIAAVGGSVEGGPTASGVVHIHLAPGADPVAAAHRLESGDLHVAEFAQPTPYAADSRCARTAH